MSAHETPGDLERKDRIDRNARDALKRIHSGQTLEDWRLVGAKLLIITEEVLDELGLPPDGWDKDNKKLTREVSQRMDDWELSIISRNQKPTTKQERWALREFMTEPKYTTWYMTLPQPHQRRLNHPNAIINRYKRAYPDPNKPNRAQGPIKATEKTVGQLQRELERVEARNAELEEERDSAASKLSIEQHTDALIELLKGQPRKQWQKWMDAFAKRFMQAIRESKPETAAPEAKPTKKQRGKTIKLGHIAGLGPIEMVLPDKK